MNSFYPSDSSVSTSDFSSSSNTPSSQKMGKSSRLTPPKPPRNKKGRPQFWEQQLDEFQPYYQPKADFPGSSSNDETADDTDKVASNERLI